jgi:hypothetical protein
MQDRSRGSTLLSRLTLGRLQTPGRDQQAAPKGAAGSSSTRVERAGGGSPQHAAPSHERRRAEKALQASERGWCIAFCALLPVLGLWVWWLARMQSGQGAALHGLSGRYLFLHVVPFT